MIIIISVGGWSIYNFISLNNVLAKITKENYISVLAAENMIGSIERQDSAELIMLVGEISRGREIYRMANEEFRRWLELEESNITLPNEGNVVNEIKNNYLKYERLFSKLSSLLENRRNNDAHGLYFGNIEDLFRNTRSRLQDLLGMNNEALLGGNSISRTTARKAAISTIAVVAAAIILSIILSLGISNTITNPLIDLMIAVKRIRGGNLNEKVEIDSPDEIGELAKEFNDMVSEIRSYQEAISAKALAEQQKALTIIKVSKDGIIVTDEKGKVIMMNPASEYIFGLKNDEAIGKDIIELTGQPDIDDMVKEVLKDKKSPHNRTILLYIDNKKHFFDIEVIALPSTGAVILLKDVTYFKNLEKVKADFLSDVSHEIRTPLTSITLGIGLLKDSERLIEMSRERELIKMLGEQTNRLNRLVDQLLEMSRLETGKVQLKLQNIPFQEFITQIVTSFKPQAEIKKVHLEVEFTNEIPILRIDPDRINSVLSNLIYNSLRYTPSGGIIRVTVSREDEKVKVSVSDTGPGIPPELRDKIFERFFQIKGRPVGEFGLGLAISRAIVEAHGGKIWMDSKEGGGSVFSFVLPVSKEEEFKNE
jgi:PAS domain S-box-containing protein